MTEYDIYKIISKDIENKNDIIYIYNNRNYTFNLNITDFNTLYIINTTFNETKTVDNLLFHYININNINDFGLYLNIMYAINNIPCSDYYIKYINKNIKYINKNFNYKMFFSNLYNSIKDKYDYPLYYAKMFYFMLYFMDNNNSDISLKDILNYDLSKMIYNKSYSNIDYRVFKLNNYELYNNYIEDIVNNYFLFILGMKQKNEWFTYFYRDSKSYIEDILGDDYES